MKDTPGLADLVLKFIKEQFPGSDISAIPRYGIEIFVDGKACGAVHGEHWLPRITVEYANPHNFSAYKASSFGDPIHAADPNFFKAVVASIMARFKPEVRDMPFTD